jgi:hypothetical protein
MKITHAYSSEVCLQTLFSHKVSVNCYSLAPMTNKCVYALSVPFLVLLLSASGSRWRTKISSAVTIRDRKASPSLQNAPTTRKNVFSIGFVFDCESPRNPSRVSYMILDIPRCVWDGRGIFIPDCYSRWNLGPSFWTGDKKEQDKERYRQGIHALVCHWRKDVEMDGDFVKK